MYKSILKLTIPLVVVFIVGCGIGTGTFTFTYEIDDTIVSSNATLDKINIDLTTESTYEDYKDKIKSVDQVAVVGLVVNNHSLVTVSGEVWLAYNGSYTDPEVVKDNGVRIFISPEIDPGEQLSINWEDGLAYIENFSDLQDAIKTGNFWIYGLGDKDEFDVTMDIDIIITFTAGY